MTPSPHLLRVVPDAPWEIVCPHPGAVLTRECMYYTPCGCTVDGEVAGWAADDASCEASPFPIKNPPWRRHHLWVRHRELVVPTLGCELVLKAARGIHVVVGEDLAKWQYATADVPPGDWAILSWARKGGRWFDTMPHLEITLAPTAVGFAESIEARPVA